MTRPGAASTTQVHTRARLAIKVNPAARAMVTTTSAGVHPFGWVPANAAPTAATTENARTSQPERRSSAATVGGWERGGAGRATVSVIRDCLHRVSSA